MEVKITDVTDILTRTVSKHGIIHGLDSFPGRAVKIIILDIPDEPIPIEIPNEIYIGNINIIQINARNLINVSFVFILISTDRFYFLQ